MTFTLLSALQNNNFKQCYTQHTLDVINNTSHVTTDYELLPPAVVKYTDLNIDYSPFTSTPNTQAQNPTPRLGVQHPELMFHFSSAPFNFTDI